MEIRRSKRFGEPLLLRRFPSGAGDGLARAAPAPARGTLAPGGRAACHLRRGRAAVSSGRQVVQDETVATAEGRHNPATSACPRNERRHSGMPSVTCRRAVSSSFRSPDRAQAASRAVCRTRPGRRQGRAAQAPRRAGRQAAGAAQTPVAGGARAAWWPAEHLARKQQPWAGGPQTAQPSATYISARPAMASVAAGCSYSNHRPAATAAADRLPSP
jgi:hypothetical protein